MTKKFVAKIILLSKGMIESWLVFFKITKYDINREILKFTKYNINIILMEGWNNISYNAIITFNKIINAINYINTLFETQSLIINYNKYFSI